ncbi:MAG: hypothetical protein HZA93_13055 [Verrucomicrobia bacterium]|nr:hypothetical protein [Verrucomicrobiota bacterium]
MPEPEVSAAEVERLVALLADLKSWQAEHEKRAGWATAQELAKQLGEDVSDRCVRKIASAACPAIVSFPGSKGYKLWQLCTIDEIGHCIEAFESQGKDMFQRAILYRRAYHKRFRGAPEAREEPPRA